MAKLAKAEVTALLEAARKKELERLTTIVGDRLKHLPARPDLTELARTRWSTAARGGSRAPPAEPPPEGPPRRLPPPGKGRPIDTEPVEPKAEAPSPLGPLPGPAEARQGFAVGDAVLVYGTMAGVVQRVPDAPGALYAVRLDAGHVVMASADQLAPA